MSKQRNSIEVKTTGPSYLGWRGELLAELALAQVPELTVHKPPERHASELRYDFLVTTEHHFCFFVAAKAFSSIRQKIAGLNEVHELILPVDAALIRQASASLQPFVLFLFDADTDHGRFLRLDDLPEPEGDRVALRLDIQNTISKKSLATLVATLEKAAKV